jgi:hypothetical protein
MGKLMVGLIFITTLALIGWAVDPATLSISEAQPPAGGLPAPQAVVRPAVEMTSAEEITQKFYDWYLAALGSGTLTPLLDGAYRSSPYLSTELVHELDSIVASFGDGPRYDPILFSSTVPQIVSVRIESLAADEARVTVHESWPNSFQDLLVRLTPVDGQWKLAELTRPVIDTQGNGTPEQAVRMFYNWYTEYARRVGNPLIDRAYQNSALSPALLNRLETARLSMSNWPAEDPILAGRNLSAGFDVALDDSGGDTASVWVRGLAENVDPLWVNLQKTEGRWVIIDIADKPAA